MEQLVAELEQLARKISAEIDTKFAKLETVIADADQRIRKLQDLLRAADGRPAIDVVVGDDESTSRGSGAAARSSGDAGSADRHARIYELADAGKPAVEIARTLGRPTGEIELILALRPKTP